MRNLYKSLAVCAVVLAWYGMALAQSATREASPSAVSFAISGFEVTGDNPLAGSESARVLAPFIGPNATLATLQQASGALEAELKNRGYSLYRVVLPPQEVGDKVKLKIVKFVIGKVTLEGRQRYSEANIRASLPELRTGETPNLQTLAVQTAIANENPGKRVQVALKGSEEADKIDAKILVKENQPWNFSLSLSNMGSESTGRDRVALVGGYSNLFDLDQQFAAAYTTSLERTSDVKQFGLNYRIPLYRSASVIALSYTKSDVVGSFGTFSSTGAGQTIGVNYSYYLAPQGGRRSFVSLGLDDKVFDAAEIDGAAAPLNSDRRSLPLILGYSARVESDNAVWGYSTELALNTGTGGNNDLESYQSEDARISKVNWKVLRGAANYTSAFSSGWLWSVRAQFQYSPDALISGEQFGLGGVSSVRGAGERDIAGDSGLSTSIELISAELLPGLRSLAFVDAGWLRNHNSEANPNKPASDHLLSAGLGLRYSSGVYAFIADWGRVLTGSALPLESGSSIPQSGDQKVHLNFTARF